MPSATTSLMLTQALLHWVLPLSLSTLVYFLLYYTKLLSLINGGFILGGTGTWLGAMAIFIALSLICYGIIQNMRIHQWFKYLPRAPGQETCLITGATQGIGFAIAKLFARDGFNLVLVARSIEELEETRRALNASYPRIGIELCQADLYMEDAPELIIRQLDRIITQRHPMWILTHLVNNAGICLRGDFIDLSLADQLSLIQLDTTNVMKMCHMVCNKWRAEYMQRNLNLEFRVMNISSFAGILVSPFMAAYTGCKAFVHNFTMALHDELYSRFNGRISCTSVCPGYTLTPGIYKMRLQHTVAHQMNLFEDVDKVAREAYYATMNGHRYTITGWSNYIMGLLSYVLPVWISSKFIRLTNADVNSIGEAWRTGGPVYVEKMHATVVPLQSKA